MQTQLKPKKKWDELLNLTFTKCVRILGIGKNKIRMVTVKLNGRGTVG